MGILISVLVIGLWLAHLGYILLYVNVDFNSVFFYLHVLFQGYLYTGLFITAHDAMHRVVSRKKTVNYVIGYIASFLFCRDVIQLIEKESFQTS